MNNFDPKQHLTTLKGGKLYLPVQWRIKWFRTENTNGVIATEVISMTPPLVKCIITNDNGIVIATGHGSANSKGTEVWSGREIEKAETAAIGRALRNAGYGTEFDDEEDDIVDAPVQRSQNARQNATKASTASGVQKQDTSSTPDPLKGLRDEITQLVGNEVHDVDICDILGIETLTVEEIKKHHAGKKPSELAQFVFNAVENARALPK